MKRVMAATFKRAAGRRHSEHARHTAARASAKRCNAQIRDICGAARMENERRGIAIGRRGESAYARRSTRRGRRCWQARWQSRQVYARPPLPSTEERERYGARNNRASVIKPYMRTTKYMLVVMKASR